MPTAECNGQTLYYEDHGEGDPLLCVMACRGEQDILVPVWKSKQLAQLIPTARLTVIEGSPHGANVERAEEFNQLVLDFVAR